MHTPGRVCSVDEVVALLAPTLGRDKSEQVVRAALVSLGIAESELTMEQARDVLNVLAQGAGLVGIAARLARRRAHFLSPSGFMATTADYAAADEEPRSRAFATHRVVAKPAPAPIGHLELVALLAPALGQEKAQALVNESLEVLGLPPNVMTIDDACVLLQHLAEYGGIVGTTATFARARLLLRGGTAGKDRKQGGEA